jgi:NADPH:quinone reductase-like Zn-dependent oxidoreductase
MRAVVVREFGGPEALELIEAPIPEPGPKQVRVAVRAAGVNPVDVAVRSGGLLGIGFTVPAEQYGVGWDVAGVVDAVGEGSAFAIGDRVVGLVDRLDLPLGAYAEFVVLDDASVGYAPRTTSDVENASLPLTLLTADQSLQLAGLAAGNSLLVTGAAGGVGGFAVQLAALRGVEVVAVAAATDEQLVRDLGAVHFVDREARVADAVRRHVPGGVDGVVDAALLRTVALEALRAKGVFVSVSFGADPTPRRGTTVRQQWIWADGPRLTELAALVDAKKLTPRVAQVLPLERAAGAHRLLEAGGLRGRVVLVP